MKRVDNWHSTVIVQMKHFLNGAERPFDGHAMEFGTPQLQALCWPPSNILVTFCQGSFGDSLSELFSVKFWKNFLHNSKKRISRINLTYWWNIGSYSSPWGPARRGCADAAAGLTAGWTLCRNRAGSTCTGVRLKGRHSWSRYLVRIQRKIQQNCKTH